jgi:hypothetical protein
VPHPIPLHPDADLAVVLDDMRQSVAAWGDEGMVMRVFRAGICLMLLSILDTLIELLADFRAGRLPPVLPAEDEPARRVGFQPTIATKCDPANEPAASGAPAPASRPIRARRTEDARAAAAGASEQSAAAQGDAAPRRSAPRLPSPRAPIRRPGHGPRAVTFYSSHVPRPAAPAFGEIAVPPMHVHFVTTSKQSTETRRRAP